MSRRGKVAVLQSGGPSSTANASLAGVMEQALVQGMPVVGVQGGLAGLADGSMRELSSTDVELERLAKTPGCALGSSRRPFDAEHQRAAAAQLRAWDAELVVIGGEGSLTGAATIASQGRGVVGVVDTCDNDVSGVVYTPGFPTAASRLGEWALQSLLDCRSLGGFDDVAILETMGRDTGWMAAAAGALAKADLTLVPERPRPAAELVSNIADLVRRGGSTLVVVAEGAKEDDRRLLAEAAGPVPVDDRGRAIVSLGVGPAQGLARLLRDGPGLQARVARPGVLQRCGRPLPFDRDAARELGRQAAIRAISGATGVAVGPGSTQPLEDIRPRRMPTELLQETGPDAEAVLGAVGWLLRRPETTPVRAEGASRERIG